MHLSRGEIALPCLPLLSVIFFNDPYHSTSTECLLLSTNSETMSTISTAISFPLSTARIGTLERILQTLDDHNLAMRASDEDFLLEELRFLLARANPEKMPRAVNIIKNRIHGILGRIEQFAEGLLDGRTPTDLRTHLLDEKRAAGRSRHHHRHGHYEAKITLLFVAAIAAEEIGADPAVFPTIMEFGRADSFVCEPANGRMSVVAACSL